MRPDQADALRNATIETMNDADVIAPAIAEIAATLEDDEKSKAKVIQHIAEADWSLYAKLSAAMQIGANPRMLHFTHIETYKKRGWL